MSKQLKSLVLAGTAVSAGFYIWKQLKGHETIDNPTFVQKYGPWAIVTGAARAEGLGFGFARQLAGRHINLVLVDILSDELEARAQELRERYLVNVKPVMLDLGRADFLPELTAVTDELEIGLLVCNHMFTPVETPTILDMDLDTHHAMLNINARAYTTLVHTYGRKMVAQRHGGILLVSSQAGMHGTPYTGAYSANKAFQLMLGESLWYELRQSNVDVLVLTPGLTRTQGTALDGYPPFMLMDVEPVVREALAGLGRQHQVIPGPVNKIFNFATTHFMSREKAVVTTGDLMAQGLNK
ncbi:MAG: SDR family NAD(P)-dependent oxidoreductase [Ardenticatenaceae bacterium]|nr:SDR family NAD(P)-dependent oxidoreductase [Anaerolineales bacterium]MCB8941152.1 SDR family NAD(P)-dependent oxidoreductase [Ardenticatenaceae bacterium]MCB8972493.1 SDR family NAD(P)-dependent oxidoreductase [Ardenticatenaceae bacterium]